MQSIVGQAHAHLVAVEGEEEFEGILEEDLYGRIEQSDSEEPPIRTVLDGQYIVRHFQRPDMDKRKLSRLDL